MSGRKREAAAASRLSSLPSSMSTNSEDCNFSMIKYCMSISESHWAGLTPRYRLPLLRLCVSPREEIVHFLKLWVQGRAALDSGTEARVGAGVESSG